MSIFRNLQEGVSDICYIWWEEMKQLFRDEGVIIFFFIVPIAYPLLYSWIYNNEQVSWLTTTTHRCHANLSACAMLRPT